MPYFSFSLLKVKIGCLYSSLSFSLIEFEDHSTHEMKIGPCIGLFHSPLVIVILHELVWLYGTPNLGSLNFS